MMSGKQTEHGTINPVSPTVGHLQNCAVSVCSCLFVTGPLNNFQDLVANGALVSICNKYGEMPVDKAKAPLRELLRGSLFTLSLSLVPPCISFIAQLRLRPFFSRTGREDGPESQPYSIQGHILEGDHSHTAP